MIDHENAKVHLAHDRLSARKPPSSSKIAPPPVDLTRQKNREQAHGTPLLTKEDGPLPTAPEDTEFPAWMKSPHSEVSHLALYVAALCTGLDDLDAFSHGPGQVIRVPRPSQLRKAGDGGHRDRTGDGDQDAAATSVASRTPRLRAAHAEAVAQIERDRQRPGQLTTGINGEVGNSILAAGALALREDSGWHGFGNEPKQFVVAAPPGTGKTSHAIALMAATVRTADPEDQSQPYGCLFVVDQIKKADDMFQQIRRLLPGRVAVWTTDHDVNSTKPTQMFVPLDRRFHVDQLEQHAVVVVTQAFLRGPRGDKAREVIRGEHKVPRELTIFDEQTREVEVYDVKQSEAIAVKEALERNLRHRDVKAKMEPLLEFIHAQSKRTGNSIETPNDDPEGWRVARDLAWFATDEAEQFVLSNSREINNLDKVFGFAAQMHNGFAFIYRRGGGEGGTHFMAYEPVATPTGNSVLLDATADIDRVSELCSWRIHVPVSQVRYDRLQVIHAELHTGVNLTDFFRKEANRRTYAEQAKNVIRDIMPAGARGLIVCKKALVDDDLFPGTEVQSSEQPTTNFSWNFDGRQLAVTWWGGHGIGANDWKDAEFVFQFGEHILPRRTLFALVQGLRRDKATVGMLSTTKSANSNPREVTLAGEGHLLRFMKQMGMRGRARSFDQHGVCGKQVLVLTCEFERLLIHADQLLPGATLSKWGRTQKHFESLTQSQMLVEILTDPNVPDRISGNEIAQRMGLEKWGSVSTNAMTPKVRRVLPNLGWTYETERGPGGGSWFVKSGNAVLNSQALTATPDALGTAER